MTKEVLKLKAVEPTVITKESNRNSGIVKWFNNDKGYGFISDQQGRDVFVHHSSIDMDGYRTLVSGQRVSYEESISNKGLTSLNVRVDNDYMVELGGSKFPEAMLNFLQAYDHDDLSDGAWQAFIEDGVTDYNEANGTNYDSHDSFMAYVDWAAAKQAQTNG